VDLDHQLVGYLQCLTKEEEEEEEVEGGVPVTIAMVKAWVRDVTQVSARCNTGECEM
jgi:hypothetical protein